MTLFFLNFTDDIPSFPVDHSYYNAVKQRVDLARLIDQESHSVAKKKHTNDWFIKAAKELDVDLDEDLVYPFILPSWVNGLIQ